MNLDPIKPIGGFIENTIRPIIQEMHWFFDECKKQNIEINENNIKRIIDYIARAHFKTCVINMIQSIIIAVILCGTWLITVNLAL